MAIRRLRVDRMDRKDSINQLLDKVAHHEKKAGQLRAQIKNLNAYERRQAENRDTARKIELGAILLNHMRENPDDEITLFCRRQLNRYVRDFRRFLFVDEFGIDPIPPPGSWAANDAADRAARKAAKAQKSAANKPRPKVWQKKALARVFTRRKD